MLAKDKPEQKDEEIHKLYLFGNDVIVEGGSGKSSQAYVFFGREKKLKIRVVIKQYKGNSRQAIMCEIKIFTLLANLKKEQAGRELVGVINNGMLDGLPHMLAYKVSKEYSEIMLTHGGVSVDKWLPRLKNILERINFAAEMLR
jgi:hypothetical protein